MKQNKTYIKINRNDGLFLFGLFVIGDDNEVENLVDSLEYQFEFYGCAEESLLEDEIRSVLEAIDDAICDIGELVILKGDEDQPWYLKTNEYKTITEDLVYKCLVNGYLILTYDKSFPTTLDESYREIDVEVKPIE